MEPPVPIPYNQLLDQNLDWAFREGSMHFEEKSAVHDALRNMARRLDELGITYALAGGMALFFHGFRRFTEDVDIVVTADGLQKLHEHLEGRDYLPLFPGSKNLRDTAQGVRIEFLVAGQYPGDGKPKPVAFPDPADIAIDRDGIRCLPLNTLIELKLASGISNSNRLRDLADVQDLIRLLNLAEELSEQLNPYVRDRYRELWEGLKSDEENDDSTAVL